MVASVPQVVTVIDGWMLCMVETRCWCYTRDERRCKLH